VSPTDAESPIVLSPSAAARPVGAAELRVLGEVGRHWSAVVGQRGDWVDALPVDPSLVPPHPRELGPSRFGRFARVEPGQVEASMAASVGEGLGARMARRLRGVVLGPPLASTAVVQERMRKLVALPVLSSDALSSVAYGPEALMTVLVLGGGGALGLSLAAAPTSSPRTASGTCPGCSQRLG
jgi:hypothetical protein